MNFQAKFYRASSCLMFGFHFSFKLLNFSLKSIFILFVHFQTICLVFISHHLFVKITGHCFLTSKRFAFWFCLQIHTCILLQKLFFYFGSKISRYHVSLKRQMEKVVAFASILLILKLGIFFVTIMGMFLFVINVLVHNVNYFYIIFTTNFNIKENSIVQKNSYYWN
jgi:hypothetical protein